MKRSRRVYHIIRSVVVELFRSVDQVPFSSGTGVDECVLDKCAEHEQHASRVPDVDRLQIGNSHRVTSRCCQLCRHRQYSRHSEGDPSRLRVLVNPESDPRQHDDEDRRNECLKVEESDETF